MSTAELRDQVKEYIAQLSPERLLVAADFLAYLTDRESEEATQELLEIPGFLEAFDRGKKDAAAGKVTPVEKLRRKY
ncbi:MAG: hypothetical protein WA828_17560 [Coleofasciculaceae cyanobacterium]